MSKRLKPLDVFKYLPKTNCKICGEETCMAFAMKLIERGVELQDCTPLFEEPKYQETKDTLIAILRPPVQPVRIGTGEKSVIIGGEEVVYRHELTFYNRTKFFVDVHDEMEKEELTERVKFVDEYELFRIGKYLHLNGIAVRSVSKDPTKFANAVQEVLKLTKMPIVLCSFDPKVMKAGLEVAKDRLPLIYAATLANWKDMALLAREYNCPLAVFSTDLTMLQSLEVALRKTGLDDLALDPGTYSGENIGRTLNTFTMLRVAAIQASNENVGHPLIAVPATVYLDGDKGVETAWNETIVGAMLIDRFASLMIIHNIELWSYLALQTLRQSIYQDPRIHPSVEPGLTVIGDPDENSPVFMTTNFALTYYTVKSDLEQAKIDSWLLAVDTEGIGVESAVAGGQLNADKVAELIKDKGLEDKVKHRILIIPGMASRISGETEDATGGWTVYVGPRDSSGIQKFLKEKWTPEATA
jgi:acetyl-CoA decarbonylase/synthase complex subunit gamma